MKKPLTIIITLFIITLLLSLVKTGVSNHIATTGIELGQMQTQIADLDTQNLVLQEKLLQLSSLLTIEAKAEKMGLARSKADYFVAAPLHVATTQ